MSSKVKAINILKEGKNDRKSKEILIQLAKIQDDFFEIEKEALEEKISKEGLEGMLKG